MKKRLIIVFCALLPFLPLEASEIKHYEMPGTQTVPIENTATEGQYELYIKLPENYDENKTTHYPVVYFTDAVWHIELLSAATSYLMEEVILVGISWQVDMPTKLLEDAGAHVSRYRDYSIEPSTNPEHQTKYQFGQASEHLAFIRNNVIKHVEANYRTDPSNRTYFGYSMGGEFGAYVLLAEPDTFKHFILGSPSVKGSIAYFTALESSTSLASKSLENNVFVSYGKLEQELGGYVDELISVLEKRSSKGLALTHELIEGDHQRAFPMTGVRSVTWLSELHQAGKSHPK